jgi:hypothetical protein
MADMAKSYKQYEGRYSGLHYNYSDNFCYGYHLSSDYWFHIRFVKEKRVTL